jgi:hypothetical protein
MVVVMYFAGMSLMNVIMGTMLTRVSMVVGAVAFPMIVRVFVLVPVFMGMNMFMLVGVFAYARMFMFVLMFVGMLVYMFMVVFMVAFPFLLSRIDILKALHRRHDMFFWSRGAPTRYVTMLVRTDIPPHRATDRKRQAFKYIRLWQQPSGFSNNDRCAFLGQFFL